MTITIKPKKYKVENTRFVEQFNKPQKKKLLVGGAGSGKSVALAMHMIRGLISGDGYRRLVLRKYFPSMTASTYIVIKEILDDWQVPYEVHMTKKYFRVGGNYLYWYGLDDPERIKGTEYKEVWMEEATEFDEDDYKQLTIRLARDKNAEDTTIFLSFNPIDEQHWCVKLAKAAEKKPDEYLVFHSTYKTNKKNLSQSFIDELENYINIDENFYRVYCLGEPGVLKHKIYDHFQIEDSSKWPWEELQYALHSYGLDFGYNHPMSLCEVWYLNDEIYTRELFYKSQCTTDDLAMWMHTNNVSHSTMIYADSAEPDRIEMLNSTRTVTSSILGGNKVMQIPRFNVIPAKKDVKTGINFIKSKKVHLCSASENAKKEYLNYKWRVDANDVPYEEPVKAWDDFMDCLRYSIFSMSGISSNHLPSKFSKGYSFAKMKGKVLNRF